ncbi:hypothetical protein [Anaerococcus vaginalis]|nr:hypothetical protein [Anaerococcus vaginalis]MDU6546464.1 hypothetical protein [Anaerococcus vaginalis]
MIQLHFTLNIEDIRNLINAEVKIIWQRCQVYFLINILSKAPKKKHRRI